MAVLSREPVSSPVVPARLSPSWSSVRVLESSVALFGHHIVTAMLILALESTKTTVPGSSVVFLPPLHLSVLLKVLALIWRC